ncbi:MAG TPA: hypothetical protein VH475_17340, partial [Tepidisphaeraceae bacterium]
MRKWSVRILVGLVALVALLLLAVQVVLWTDLPRQWVLSAIEQKLQLRVGARSFDTGWGGHTSLSGVTLSLPLSQESFLQTTRLSIDHTGLMGLIVGRGLKLESIEIDRPDVLLRQMPDGRWNLQEVVELVRRASGGKTVEGQSRTPGLVQLPRVRIAEGTVRLVNLAGRQATLGPLTIRGDPDGPLAWKFEASTPGRLDLTGVLAPGADWAHQASISVRGLGPLVRPFLNAPSPALLKALENFELAGRWDGRVSGNLQGRLDLRKLYLGGYTVTGPLNVSLDQGVATIVPRGAQVTSPSPEQIPAARAGGGSIFVDGHSVTVEKLSLALAGGEVRVGGSYAWDRGAGKVEAWWNQLMLPKGTTHNGTITASLRQPWPNQPDIDLELTTEGAQDDGSDTWSASIKLDGHGTSWSHIDWTIGAPKLVFTRAAQTYNLDGTSARLSTRGDLMTLDDISIPPGNLYGRWKRGTLEAHGAYHRSTGQWYAYATGKDWPLSPKGNRTPADFVVNVSGDRTWARLGELFIAGAGVEVWAEGDLSYGAKGMPAELNMYAWFPPIDYTWRERGGQTRDDVRLSGRMRAELHVTGGAREPIRLDVNGKLYAHELMAKGHALGDVALRLTGRADDDGVSVRTERLRLMSGQWDLAGRYTWHDRLTRVNVDLAEGSLAQLDNFAAAP